MNRSQATLAYAQLVTCIMENNPDIAKHIQTLNNFEYDEAFKNQIIDGLMSLSLDIRKENYANYCQVINELDIITEKQTYCFMAEIHAQEQSNKESIQLCIQKGLTFDFRFQCSNFAVDAYNVLIAYAIYVRDEESLKALTTKLEVYAEEGH